MIDEKNTQQQKKRTKNNAQSRKKQKHKTKSTFIRARRVKHPYNVRTLLLLRSRKIQSKPVSDTSDTSRPATFDFW